MVAGWISRQQVIVIEYLRAENRTLRERPERRSLRFNDRALLARKAVGISRKALRAITGPIMPQPSVGYSAQNAVGRIIAEHRLSHFMSGP